LKRVSFRCSLENRSPPTADIEAVRVRILARASRDSTRWDCSEVISRSMEPESLAAPTVTPRAVSAEVAATAKQAPAEATPSARDEAPDGRKTIRSL
jgi:hypothetical protein